MATGSQNMTTYNARIVTGSNSAASPAGALLLSGAGRADDATGDTWLFLDSRGGTDTPWGIKHDQANNQIQIFGAGTNSVWTQMNTGNTYIGGNLNTGSVLTVRAQNNTHEGGEIILSPATSSFVTVHVDAYDNLFRLHDGTNERFKVNVSTGNATVMGKLGVNYNSETAGNTYQLYVNGNACIYQANSNVSTQQAPGLRVNGKIDIYDNVTGGGVANSLLNILYNGTHEYGVPVKIHSYGGDSPAIRFSKSTSIDDINKEVNTSWTVGMYYNSTDAFAITRGRGPAGWGTADLVINSSGNVGIGTTSPTYKLHINGTTYHADHVYLAAAKHIYMSYNSTNYNILHNHNNGNISVNAAGTGLYMAYQNTTFVNWMNGRMELRDGCLSLFPNNSSYREGLRIHATGSWSDITLCGNDNTGNSGTSANSWFIGNNNGNFYISRNGSSSSSSAILSCVSNVWSWNGTASGSISGNANTATTWQTARTLTVGNKGQSVNGSANVSWTLNDILYNATTIGTSTSWDQAGPSVYYVNSSAAFTGTNHPGNNSEIMPYTYGQLIVSRAGSGGVLQIYAPHIGSGGAVNAGLRYRTGWNSASWQLWSTLLDDRLWRKYIFCNKNINRSQLTVSDSTWNVIPSGAIDLFGLAFKDTALSNDTGDIRMWLQGTTTLHIQIDGAFHASEGFVGNASTATKLSNTPNNTTTFLRGDNTWTSTINNTIYCIPPTSNMAASNMAFNGGIQLRENGGVGNGQSAIEYGPRISFHWSNRVAKSITLHSNGTFYFRDQNGTTRSTIDANVVGNVTGNCSGSAGSVAWNNVGSKPATATRWPAWSEVTSKPAVQNNLTSTSTTDMLSAAQGKALNDKIASVSKVVDYTYAYGAISANGNLDITGTQLKVSTPSGYTPVAMTRFATGHPQVIPALFNARNTGSNVVIRLRALNSVTGGTVYISILYIRNS